MVTAHDECGDVSDLFLLEQSVLFYDFHLDTLVFRTYFYLYKEELWKENLQKKW